MAYTRCEPAGTEDWPTIEGFRAPESQERAYLLANGVVSSRARVVYIPTPKVAYTTLLWVLATLEGHPDQHVAHCDRREFSREMTIHDPSVNRIRRLGELRRDALTEVLTSSDWLRVGVTRDPYSRVVSGWADRILVRQPDVVWDPESPNGDEHDSTGALELGRSFRRFVGNLTTPDSPWRADAHFAPQASTLVPCVVPYTHLVDVKSLKDLVAEIRRRAGVADTATPFHNAGLPLDLRLLYDSETARTVEALYRADFDELHYPEIEFTTPERAAVLDPMATALLHQVRDARQRIVDLSAIARERRGGRYAASVLRTLLVARLGSAMQRVAGRAAIPRRHSRGRFFGFSRRVSQRR